MWELPDYSFVRKQIMAAPRQRRSPQDGCSFQEDMRACKRTRPQSPDTQPGKKAKVRSSCGGKDPPGKAALVPLPLFAEE